MSAPSEWPLPSNSRRVSAFFYLADGLAMASGLLLLLGMFGALLFLLYRNVLDGFASGGIVLFVFVSGYFLIRRTAAFRETSRTTPDDPQEANDWKRTRDWLTMSAVILLLAGGIFGLMVLLWTMYWTRLLSVMLPFVFAILGIALRLYGFHRLGVRVI